jgi:flagellar biosynthesis chaperone FliJ
MTSRRWLPVMIRARKATEDAAARQVAQDRRAVADALLAARRESQRLDQLSTPQAQSAQAFLAGVAASNAAAATHSAALQRAAFSQQRLAGSIIELTDAARARRTVEKLAERIAETERAEELAADQRALDELSVTRFNLDGGDQA